MFTIFLGMAAVIIAVIFLNHTGSLLMIPAIFPEAFLSSLPYTPIRVLGREVILIEPSSTIIVYALGLIMVGLGIGFIASRQKSNARKYWGIGLILWGLGAITAGTSYQAFGYELKCRGRELCQFTSIFELVYMLLTAYSINFLVTATAYASLAEKGRKWLIVFAVVDGIAYSIFMLIGALIPNRFMVSYEGFMVFVGGNFVLMFILSIRHYLSHRDCLNLCLTWLWVGFLVVNLGYFAALFSGYAAPLFVRTGIWFNENDVLHSLLILWAGQIFFSLWKRLADQPVLK